MINVNGKIANQQAIISLENRGYKFGDGLFETIKAVSGKILFWEDHYFRLMASMRILRMEIPMNFTMEFLESEIKKTLEANSLLDKTARIRISIDRGDKGVYLPVSKEVNYFISCSFLENVTFLDNGSGSYEVDLFKDHFVAPGLLSSIKSSCKNINVLASIFAQENGLHNCLLLNTNKSVVEATNGNLFLVKDNVIKTPPISDGCLNGVLRKQIIDILKKSPDLEFEEVSISPFELQKADELFITNVITGVQPITKYRKKTFNNDVAKKLLNLLNKKVEEAG